MLAIARPKEPVHQLLAGDLRLGKHSYLTLDAFFEVDGPAELVEELHAIQPNEVEVASGG